MPTLAETALPIREQVREIPVPSFLQSSGEFVTNDGIKANPPTHEQATDVIGATTPVPDQKIDGTVLPEMPNSHPEVNAATISVSGLIKNCPHYAEMYREDPERAKAEATQTTQKAQEVSALREQGMSAKEIKAKMLADNLARAKVKAEVVEKEDKAEPKSEAAREARSEKLTESVKPTPEAQQTAGSDAITGRKLGNAVSEPNKIVTPKPKKITARENPQQQLHQEQPNPLDYGIPTEVHPLHKQQIQEALPAILSNKSRAAFTLLESQSSSAAEIARQTFAHELLEPEHAPESIEQLSSTNKIQVEHMLPTGNDTVLFDELSDLTSELGVGQEATNSMEVQAKNTSLVTESLLKDEQTEPAIWTDELAEGIPILIETPAAVKQVESMSWADELVQELHSNRASVWEAELAKDDMEIYENFTEALNASVELTWTLDGSSETSRDINAETSENIEDELPLPLVTIQVAEKLQDLDDDGKEAVAPLLKDIVGTVHGILLLEEREANPETITEVQGQLEALCVQLFETLGIDYDEDDVKQFTQVLLTPGFKPSLPVRSGLAPVELLDEGTHEIKNFDNNVSSSPNVRSQPHQIIGMLILLSVRMQTEASKASIP